MASTTTSPIVSTLTKATISVLLASALSVANQAVAQQPTQSASAATDVAAEVAFKVYPTMDAVIKAHPGKLPMVIGTEYVGSSLLPFGSRDKALQEATLNAQKTQYKRFVVTHDREERTEGLISGVSRVIKLRRFDLLDKTPDHVMLVLTSFNENREIQNLLTSALKEPEMADRVSQLKVLVQKDQDKMPSGVPMATIVRTIIQHEGKSSAEQLKKWAKFHSSTSVREEAMLGLMEFGDHDVVDELVKAEPHKLTKLRVEEKLRKARMGG